MILFPSNYLNAKEPDQAYAPEYAMAQQMRLPLALLDSEAADEENYVRATRFLAKSDQRRTAIYRGWMFASEQYARLFEALLARGVDLINSPEQYKRCHEFPGTWEQIRHLAPPAVHVPLKPQDAIDASLFECILQELQPFEGAPAILKDYVKSAKEYWDEACFIPDTSKRGEVERVVRRFLELRGEMLTGGLVFKKYIEMVKDGQGSCPKEYRLFYLDQMLVLAYPPQVHETIFEEIPIEQFHEAASNIDSRFFSLDVARGADGKWWVIEVGDGQVSGLPEPADVGEFYRAVKIGNAHLFHL